MFDFINSKKNNSSTDNAKSKLDKEPLSQVNSETTIKSPDENIDNSNNGQVQDKINEKADNPAKVNKKRKLENEEIEQFNKDTSKELLENISKTNNLTNNNTKSNNNDSKQSDEKSYNFNDLAVALGPLETVKGKGSKDIIKEAIANIFETLLLSYPNDVVRVYYFLLCNTGPEYRTKEMGIGNEIVQKCVAKAIGKNDKIVRDLMKEIGELGQIAYDGKQTLGTMDSFFIKKTQKTEEKILTMKNIFDCFNDIANISGNSSVGEKEKILLKLLFACKKDEIKFLVRTLFKPKTLKISASFKTVIASLARGIFKVYSEKKSNKNKNSLSITEKEIERSLLITINQMSDYDIIFQELIKLVTNNEDFRELTNHCPITPGIPLKPMLAKPTTGIQIIFQRFDGVPFTCEYKYDGFRGQIHGYKNSKGVFVVEVFSRNLENMTEAYPDVVHFFYSNYKDSKTFILDCEIVPYDTVTNKILPFQSLTTRAKKNVNVKDITIKVCLFLFDIIYLDGVTYIHKTLEERREILTANFKETDEIKYATNITSENAEDIETIMKEAVEAGIYITITIIILFN